MDIEANLRIKLYANNVLVAEISDPELWANILAKKAGDKSPRLLEDRRKDVASSVSEPTPENNLSEDSGGASSPIDVWAGQLGISADDIISACEPSRESPFLDINAHYWAALKKNTPPAGKKAINVVVLVATVLVRWAEYAQLGDVQLKQVRQIVKNLGEKYANADRSLKNCSWLKRTGNVIKLSPAEIGEADDLVKAFCMKKALARNVDK